MKWLIIGEENDVSVLDTSEMQDFLQHFDGKFRLYRICGIRNTPQEFQIHYVHRSDVSHGYVSDFFNNLAFNF